MLNKKNKNMKNKIKLSKEKELLSKREMLFVRGGTEASGYPLDFPSDTTNK